MHFDLYSDADGVHVDIKNSTRFDMDLCNNIKPLLEKEEFHHDQDWIVDLPGVQFIDSNGVGFLLIHALKAKKNKHILRVTNATTQLRQTMDAMNLQIAIQFPPL